MEKGRSVFKMFTGKPTGKRPVGRPRCRQENSVRINLKTGAKGRSCVNSILDGDYWRALMNMVLNLQFPYTMELVIRFQYSFTPTKRRILHNSLSCELSFVRLLLFRLSSFPPELLLESCDLSSSQTVYGILLFFYLIDPIILLFNYYLNLKCIYMPIKSRILKFSKHVTRMRKCRSALKILTRTPTRKMPLGRSD